MAVAHPGWRVAWITGASTGIGRALALRLARDGVLVAATARSADKLADLSRQAPGIRAYPADVSSSEQLRAVVASIEGEHGPIDLAVLNAGVWEQVSLSNFTVEPFRAAIDVNYLGAVRGIEALLPAMRERRRGHIALVASVAGYRGLPLAASYGPSKAALINLAECLKPEFDRAGLTISIVNPGFVDTPLTAKNDFPMPFMMSAEAAADRIAGGLATRRFEVAFPWRLVSLLKLARILPYWAYFSFVRTFILPRR